ncbi:MAG: RNA polymerase-associated protein rapA [Chromatiales bacterium]|nr:RNA polymerase-associated protein rapA [Chromatiales bacterium]
MFQRKLLAGAVSAALAVPAAATAEWEWEANGYFKNETAFFTRDGYTIGQANKFRNPTNEENDAGDLLKFENSVRVFANGYGDTASIHLDLNLINNGKGVDRYRGHRNYSQQDYLRELYVDYPLEVGEDRTIDLRLGKQQVVWGTADGIKLLDIINPTDFREFNQNTFEDSRIPVWMINAETAVGDTGNVQFIVSQNKPNLFPGLTDDGDEGHPFIVKGVDSITGRVNGFLNVAPALGQTAAAFGNFAAAFTLTDLDMDITNGAQGLFNSGMPTGNIIGGEVEYQTVIGPNGFFGRSPNLEGVFGNTFTVMDFINGTTPFCVGGPFAVSQLPNQITAADASTATFVGTNASGTSNGCTDLLNQVAQRTDTNQVVGGIPYGGNDDTTNLVTANFDATKPDNTFEYMSNASYTTFDTFNGAKARYRTDYPGSTVPNAGFRYRGSVNNTFNFSLNYFYHFDANPSVSTHWEDQSGNRLTPFVTEANGLNFADPTNPQPTGQLVRTVRLCKSGNMALCDDGQVDSTFSSPLNPNTGAPNNPNVFTPLSDGPATLVFTETQHRIHSLGASFDTAVDTSFLGPIVLRGEFLYDKDVRVPVVDRSQLGIGNITEGLRPEKADFFKYVLGVDITVLTNLLISTQFIQFVNLDYVDDDKDTFTGADCAEANCGRYTGDPAILHLSNGLAKAEEFDNYVSLFFSKPFGEGQLGRFNNITIWEEGDGYWNRFDMEYSFTDELVVTAEWNHYFGSTDTTFGQMKNSSNVQVGFKYIFE